MPTTWYCETSNFAGKRSPCKLVQDGEPSTEKMPNGAPSPYKRVEALNAGQAKLSPDVLWNHFNPSDQREINA